jgi:DNA repair protein RecO (recombination protein O)
MQIHKTKGIVLRTVKYGETSIITTVYTELFGIQSYIVKGVRQSSKKSQGKSNYFQPAAILDMEVYHNELKNLQFIKDFQWAFLYQNIFFDVIRNAVAMYAIELLQHSLKQPEANPELFYLSENILQLTDAGNNTTIANIPAYFTLQLASQLGFQIHGEFAETTAVLDLKEGFFASEIPLHPFYITGELAMVTSSLLHISNQQQLSQLILNRNIRQELLQAYHQFMTLHIATFPEMKSLKILQEVLG